MGTTNCKSTEQEINPDSITIITKDQVKYETFQSPPPVSEVQIASISSPPDLSPQLFATLSKPSSGISFQGELEKFQPGFKSKYMTRWVVLSSTELKYYKNEYSSCFYFNKPIGLIHLDEIKDILYSESEKKFEVVMKNPNFMNDQNKTQKGSATSQVMFLCKDDKDITKWIESFRANGVSVLNN
jgi:hypothetical protein